MTFNTANTLPEMAITANKTSQPNKKPNRQRGRVPFEIQLQSMDARLLFLGKHTPGAVDLLSFGKQMALIWDAAKEDDPYADWMLLKIYDAMTQLHNKLSIKIQAYQESIQKIYSRDNLIYTPFVSDIPIVRSLWFSTPYGYLAAGVVSAFDFLIRTVLTAYRVGVLLEEQYDIIKDEWVSQIEAFFKLPFKWKSFQLTRLDVQVGNDKARSAQSVLGKPPKAILEKMVRAPFSPDINVLEISNQAIVDNTAIFP